MYKYYQNSNNYTIICLTKDSQTTIMNVRSESKTSAYLVNLSRKFMIYSNKWANIRAKFPNHSNSRQFSDVSLSCFFIRDMNVLAQIGRIFFCSSLG